MLHLPRPLVQTFKPAATRWYSSQMSSMSSPRYNRIMMVLSAPIITYAGYYMYNYYFNPVLPKFFGTKTLKSALDSQEYRPFTLKEVRDINHNTKWLRFELPPNHVSGLTIASALLTKFDGPDGKPIVRPYTPTSDEDAVGYLDLIVKRYNGGKMSEHIHSLKPGDALKMSGPIPKFKWEPNQFEAIGLIAGGTGITPMYQVIRAITKNPADKTKIHLIYANVTEEDILLKEEFDRLTKEFPDQFFVQYKLNKPPTNWPKSNTGYITTEDIAKLIPSKDLGNKVKVFVCGPPPQVASLAGPKGLKGAQGELSGALAELGYTSEQVFKF